MMFPSTQYISSLRCWISFPQFLLMRLIVVRHIYAVIPVRSIVLFCILKTFRTCADGGATTVHGQAVKMLIDYSRLLKHIDISF